MKTPDHRSLFTGRLPLPHPGTRITDSWPWVALSLLLFVSVAGCQLMQTATGVPGQAVRAITPGPKEKPAPEAMEVQQNLLRFAEEFAAAMIIDAEKLRRGTNPLTLAELLPRKIALTTEICSIASGPNAVANLLDMTIFVTVTRMALEEYWQPKVYGDSALSGLEDCRLAEKEIWRLAGQVLKPEQQAELHVAIEAWHRLNPHLENLLAARAMGVASQVAQAHRADASKPDSV